LYILLGEGDPVSPYASLADAQAAGAVTLNYGLFINAVISFLIVAFVIFLLIRNLNRLRREEEAPVAEPTTQECPYCRSAIPLDAVRCAFCTSHLPAG
jgi:large conductance mechanosensitive channel